MTTQSALKRPGFEFFLPVSLLVALAMALFVIWVATAQPWMGSGIRWNAATGAAQLTTIAGAEKARIVSIDGGGQSLRLEAQDFTIEPAGGLATFADFYRFLNRQSTLAAIQRSTRVTFVADDGSHWSVTPQTHRPLRSFGADFWVQIFVGIVAWLIAASVWVFRPHEPSARYLLLSGAATLVFAPLSAIYTTRELAIQGTLFRVVNDLNFLGGSLFAAAFAAVLLYYPRTIAPRWIGRAIVGVAVVWWLAQEIDLFTSMPFARRALVMVDVLASFALAALQWRLTARDPIARAALQWFLLAWMVGVSAFVLLILAPQLAGIDTSAAQGYGFLLFLLVYGGLGFGILRYRLFDIGEWWLRVIGWIATVLALVIADIVFAMGLELSAGLSLALALLISALVWLPIRSWIWHRSFARSAGDPLSRLQTVLDAALAARPEEQVERWRSVLTTEFTPLQIGPAEPSPEPALVDNGLGLLVPGAGPAPALLLSHADSARRLFNRRDLATARELHALFAHSLRSRDAFEAGAKAERTRIAGDIHDNIGARLLTALHASVPDRKNSLIRETLADLRSIINDISTGGGTLAILLASLRRETAERLAARGITLDWPTPEDDGRIVSAGTGHTLHSIIREAVSNILKHAQAKSVRIDFRQTDDATHLVIADDGVGLTSSGAGNGMAILRRRVAGLGGAIDWQSTPGGGVSLRVSLPAAASTPIQGLPRPDPIA